MKKLMKNAEKKSPPKFRRAIQIRENLETFLSRSVPGFYKNYSSPLLSVSMAYGQVLSMT